jgi:hypothetical protein
VLCSSYVLFDGHSSLLSPWLIHFALTTSGGHSSHLSFSFAWLLAGAEPGIEDEGGEISMNTKEKKSHDILSLRKDLI